MVEDLIYDTDDAVEFIYDKSTKYSRDCIRNILNLDYEYMKSIGLIEV